MAESPSSPRTFVYSGNRYQSGGGGGMEYAQTYFIERQNSSHQSLAKMGVSPSNGGPGLLLPFSRATSTNSLRSGISSTGNNGESSRLLMNNSDSNGSLKNYLYYGGNPALNEQDGRPRTLRFQVVLWNVGRLDIVTGAVPMTFRISLFWNDHSPPESDDLTAPGEDGSTTCSTHNVWRMHGRQKAFQQELRDVPIKAMEVPPVSILNVATFETIGSAEVNMLNEETRLMRWSCMYRASVLQQEDNCRVEDFPHDDHDLHLKLAILTNRGRGKIWDRRVWKLALATADDAQSSTRIPHGLIVDQARIPEFSYNKERGLQFQFCQLDHGAMDQDSHEEQTPEMYLRVSLNVLRESGYYDNNIVPLLALLNVVAVSVLTFQDTEFFYRALITLNIAFVEMGIRMTADSHLPSVGYEIRLQRILNEFFVMLMMLVLESMMVYVVRTYTNVSEYFTFYTDWAMAVIALAHNFYILNGYYQSKRRARQRLDFGWRDTKKET